MSFSPNSRPRLAAALFVVIILGLAALCASRTFAQQATATPASKADAAVFDAASDEVLAQMSEITGLALRSPLKKSLRSEEHTSELQSLRHLVCRLLLEKK